MRERGALRPAGRAAGVEQPRIVRRRDIGEADPFPFVEGPELHLPDDEHAFHLGQAVADRSQRVRQVRRDGHDPSAGILEDVGEFRRVQPGIDRHGAKACMPDAIEQFDEFGAVLHRDRHTVSGPKTCGAQGAGDSG